LRLRKRDTDGFVKVISNTKTGEIFGMHILGNEAPELVAECVLAMNMEGSVDEVHRSIHAHATLSEALMEAAAATSGEAIHS
jgi:dihydrolipoamide dehydrogenase